MEKKIKKEEVSFTKTVKEEIALFERKNDKEIKALLSGFIKINGNLIVRNNTWIISIKSENVKAAKLIFKEIKRLYPVDARIIISEKKKLRTSNNNLIVNIEIAKGVKDILEDLEIYDEKQGFNRLPSKRLLPDNETKKDYIAGTFLASGSVNSPSTKNYHLEVSVNTEEYAEYLIKMFKRFYLDAKMIERRSQYVVYIKRSEQIADFLKLIKAWQSLLRYEETRIQRDQYNSLNRLYNCEISNEKKAMDKGAEQVALIEWYDKKIGVKSLDEPLRIVAEARLANPEATYLELADYILDTNKISISKSGLSYRMSKLLDSIKVLRGEKR